MPILATKLYTPPPRPNVVLRPRLIERLNEGLTSGHKLTLISAPAGFGKTTLVSEWVASRERPVAWLSLDEEDCDLTRFLAYLVAALQTIALNVGAEVLRLLQSPQPLPTESILTVLLNEITSITVNFVLVLDDYHVIDARPVDNALTFLLEHLPPQVHLVIATREDPPFPLARLRARGQLTELRAADLRFTTAEAAEFLNQVMSLNVSAEDIATLETRTEGWIAGLQLAALSTRGKDNVHEFIRAFAGDNRYIVDYLVEEVLKCQSERIRSFLLQTSILDWLNGALCDAVTDQEESNVLLEALERSNLFISPQDDKRHWFRYHHLFAEVLRMRLMVEQPDLIATLHQRASEWYAQNGSTADAIRHALAAKDFERASDLIELAWPAMRSSRQEASVLGWIKVLPDKLFQARPVLSVVYAWALLVGGQIETVEARLRDAERWLDTTADGRERPEAPSEKMVVRDEEEFHLLPGTIAIYRAAIALTLGDLPETVKYARRALDLVPDDDHLRRGSATAFLGLASWASGDLETAHRTYADGMASVLSAGYLSDAINSAITLADIRIAQGRLHEAMSTYERALQLATERGMPALRESAGIYVGVSELEREHNDLSTAIQNMLRSKELGEHTGLTQNRYRWCVAMARIQEAQGNLDSALDLLDEAERLYVSDFHPNVRPVAALKTRVWLAQGRLGEALGWVQEKNLSVEDDLSYLREFEHITLVRVLLTRYRSDRLDHSTLEAIELLERLLKAAEEGGRAGSTIEILVLQALAHQALGDIPAALLPLHQALTLAEPEGYVRIFVDEGDPMRSLLLDFRISNEKQPRRNDHELTEYVDKLISAFTQPMDILQSELIEPLSQRELEVLRLIAQGRSNREISERLFLALSSVKGHNQMIFSKLQVQSRTEAVARARELGLL
jgi:LuxR family transcriptional regulator, maltose regulon positive regulatory protein